MSRCFGASLAAMGLTSRGDLRPAASVQGAALALGAGSGNCPKCPAKATRRLARHGCPLIRLSDASACNR
jgi:hypothetical protein